MKKCLLTLAVIMLALVTVLGSLASCDKSDPTKLDAPVVTLEGNVATWQANSNADKFEISLDGNISYVENTVTSKTLTNGQSLKVRAVGDGSNYSTSDWSNTVTYTAGGGQQKPSIPEGAPLYLGITASNEQPSENGSLPEIFMRRYASNGSDYVSLEESLRSFLSNQNNSLGDTAPVASNYGIYSAAGRTVYVQIWLENPEQNTILSLKLNGVKHQTGGALQSFFIADGDSYKNCVYVAVTIPSGSYKEIAYVVTEIEYVEGTNINQDGKAVFIDEDNDTVKIGLPYQQDLPTATLSDTAQTASTISFTVNVTDNDNYVSLVGGWLRVIVYNNQNEILGQKKISAGSTNVTFDGLGANTYYTVMVFVLGDTHDGNGVYAHSIVSERYKTANVISCEVQSSIEYNSQTEKYYPIVSVDATLTDPNFSFTKVELCDFSENVLFTSSFNGSIEIDQVLCGNDYVVKVYYKNANGAEQSYRTYANVERFDYPSITYDKGYGLISDAVIGFDFGDGKYNLNNIKIKLFAENSVQYLAENAIYLIEHPNAIEELEEQWSTMDRADPNWFETGKKINALRDTQTKIEWYFSDVTEQEWRNALAKGIYIYEFDFGTDNEVFKGADNKYYVVIEDYIRSGVDKEASWQYIITADIDEGDGQPAENRTILEGWFKVDFSLTERDYLFSEEFTLRPGNVVYLETKSRNNLGGESYKELGYVNQIVLARGYDICQVLWTQEEPDHDIDEAAWLADVKSALIAGENVEDVFPLGDMLPIMFDLDNVDITVDPGEYMIRFTYVMYGKDYTGEDEPYDWDGSVIDYTVAA